MELRHLRTFVALAEELHFARAARRLFVDPAAVTRTLQALEDELEVSLVIRSRRDASLTAAGRGFLSRARRILQDAELAMTEARELADGRRGRITMAIAGYTAVSPMPEVIRALRRRHPDISIDLQYIPSQLQPQMLREGRCDVALTVMPMRDPELEVVPVLQDELMLLLSEDHHLASRDTVSLSDLNDETHVLLPRSDEPALHRAFRGAFTDSPPSTHIIEAAELSVMLALVAANQGISYAPRSMQRLRYDGITTRSLTPTFGLSFFALYPRATMSPLVPPLLGAFDAVTTVATG